MPVRLISNFELLQFNIVFDEKVITVPIDYYYSNVIARASKTMSECRNLKIDFQKTGTEG